MTLFARIALDPSTLVAWLIVGALCAWLAAKMISEASYGLMGDVFLGALGAFVGGCVFGLLVSGDPAFWGTMVLAFVGACVLIGLARLIAAMRGAE
jgi:uncharacterized membrane protein YeaQ/YmgE (transglycosylase-associated protein family)